MRLETVARGCDLLPANFPRILHPSHNHEQASLVVFHDSPVPVPLDAWPAGTWLWAQLRVHGGDYVAGPLARHQHQSDIAVGCQFK